MKKVNIGILAVAGIVASMLLGMYGVQTSHAAASFSTGAQSGLNVAAGASTATNNPDQATSSGCASFLRSQATSNPAAGTSFTQCTS